MWKNNFEVKTVPQAKVYTQLACLRCRNLSCYAFLVSLLSLLGLYLGLRNNAEEVQTNADPTMFSEKNTDSIFLKDAAIYFVYHLVIYLKAKLYHLVCFS